MILRQKHLISRGVPTSTAYDTARQELYRLRHHEEVSARVAREEALAVGAFFGQGPNEVGMTLEDQQFEKWKVWAKGEAEKLKQLQGSAYTGQGSEEEAQVTSIEDAQAGLEEVSDSVPGSKRGQEARGGAVVHP